MRCGKWFMLKLIIFRDGRSRAFFTQAMAGTASTTPEDWPLTVPSSHCCSVCCLGTPPLAPWPSSTSLSLPSIYFFSNPIYPQPFSTSPNLFSRQFSRLSCAQAWPAVHTQPLSFAYSPHLCTLPPQAFIYAQENPCRYYYLSTFIHLFTSSILYPFS